MKKILTILLLAFWTAVPASAQDQAVDDPRGAMDFIRQIADETVNVWSDSKLTEDERKASFRHIFEEATDIDLLARGMLGRHYRTITTEQRTRYMAAMRDFIVAEFDKRMQQVGFKTLDITGTKAASGKNGHIFVRTEVKREEGQPILADWRVRKSAGKFQVVNLEFEGINLMITNRDVFSSKISEVGIEGLISWLKEQSS
ncbi:MlaC/ttg2D family ABC transporter substrate-binding protein [Kordiimonas pumila]|uniref:Phospholipid-binding protein MlaC n=1 Tax=Kordiimonas pumila TaxID=2161677 RepID=A0ABV7D3S2_9PROT|nr:ABC transporter substrate-binding protein [Kordiimonas pumila]